MITIDVCHFSRHFKIYKKDPGLFGSLKSLVHRTYEISKAVDDISFTIQEGELVGFIGPNGAGKTTTLKTLSGLLYPTSGTVSVLGFTPWERKREYLSHIALVMGQKNQLWWDLPPIESFLLNKEIYKVPDSAYKKRLDELVGILEVEEILNVPVRKLSLGQRMKCELIATLLHAPKIVFLDEPTIGLDVVMQQNVRDFIHTYNQRHNATIILTSHYMKDVQQLCKRVLFIDHGKIVFDGKLEDIIKRYGGEKIVRVLLKEKVEKKAIEEVGNLVEYRYPHVVLSVPLSQSTTVAATILQKWPVEDLNIEEADIETVMRDMFART